MVHPAAGADPVAHSAASVCVLKKGTLSKASKLLYLRVVFFKKYLFRRFRFNDLSIGFKEKLVCFLCLRDDEMRPLFHR